MSTKQKNKYLIYSIVLTSIFTAFTQADAAPSDAGAELNRIRQQIEQEKKHKDIPKDVFKNEKVKSVANCKACHSDIEKGLIEYENIKDISDFM